MNEKELRELRDLDIREIRLSRKLAREIQYVIDSGGVMPVQIRNAYKPLKEFYDECIEESI